MQEETTDHGNDCPCDDCEMHRADLQFHGESGDGWSDPEQDTFSDMLPESSIYHIYINE